MPFNVICLEEEAFYRLIEEVVERILKKSKPLPTTSKWITTYEAMRQLGITSKTTLQRYRDEGRIRYSQADRKVIMYDSRSIDEYLEKHARDVF